MYSYPRGTEMQQNHPPLSAVQIDLCGQQNLYHNSHYSASAYYPNPQSQNPNPNLVPDYSTNSLNGVVIQPPGLDPVNVHISSGYEARQLGLPRYTYSQAVGSAPAAAPAYFLDPNAAISPCGLNPYAAGVTIPSTGAQKLVTANPNIGSQRSSTWKKGPKKIKVLQSAWCEICRVDCNSRNVLDQHKLGKKHKKNLEKLIVANTSVLAPAPVSAPVPPPASTIPSNPVIGPQENPDKAKTASSQKARKKAAVAEDLETKRKKVLEGGAALDAVQTCAICNVVCNSETVFRFHLAGQKHTAMMKKHASATGVAAAT